MATKIFVDFDGTVTTRDTGNALFARFSGNANQPHIDRYHQELLSARGLFLAEAALAGAFPPEELEEFLAAQELDPGFGRFAAFCAAQGFALCILSDGLDLYIDSILTRQNLAGIMRFANNARLVPAGAGRVRLALEFPAQNPECDRCACCKRNIMLSRAGERDTIVYVGDGYSDRCPAGYADLVFAKRELQTYCQAENISYLPYATFDDVRRRLETFLSAPRPPRKRHRAELKRQEAFRVE